MLGLRIEASKQTFLFDNGVSNGMLVQLKFYCITGVYFWIAI